MDSTENTAQHAATLKEELKFTLACIKNTKNGKVSGLIIHS